MAIPTHLLIGHARSMNEDAATGKSCRGQTFARGDIEAMTGTRMTAKRANLPASLFEALFDGATDQTSRAQQCNRHMGLPGCVKSMASGAVSDSVGQAWSLAEMIGVSVSGQSIAKAGSFQRTPPSASGA